LGKHFTSSLLFAVFEKRVCANKESSSYIYIVSYIYIEREREKRLERFGGEEERERERFGKTRVVASSSRVVVVVEREVHQSEPEKSIGERKRYKRVHREL
jgi:hypothetical protein